MSLSVCCLTREPPSRLAVVLEPLREVADEFVLAVDDRASSSALDGYAALADRVFTVEFVLYERHLAWLHAQCSSDWILRLDGDEVVSAAFLRRLPELLERRDVHQYFVKRSWLFGDSGTVLDELPWSADHLPRLVSNDGTLRSGDELDPRAAPVFPRAYVLEPIYHLDLLLNDERSRRAKVVRYEAVRPGLEAPGGGRFSDAFHLPELRGRLSTDSVATEDIEALRRAVAADGPVPAGSAARIRRIPLAEMDAWWSGRGMAEEDCAGTIRPLETARTLVAGQHATIMVEVCNDGGAYWPGGLDELPLIRVAYRWLNEDGTVHTAEGERTGFPGPIGPGGAAVVPARVLAPRGPGVYTLELDLVHEFQRWFGVPSRIAVMVAESPPASNRPRLVPTTVRPPSPNELMRIPRVVHRVWLGDAPMPDELQSMGATFESHLPGWEQRLWRDDDLAALGITDRDRERARSPSELSNIVRYEVLSREGGLYVDTDVECLRNVEPLLRGVEACAALELPGRLGNAVLAGVPGHELYVRAAAEGRLTLGVGPHSASANGPHFVTLIAEQTPGVTIFDAHVFYPYGWDSPERAGDAFPDAYLVHHWALSWWDAE